MLFAKLSELNNGRLLTLVTDDKIATRSDLLVCKATDECHSPDPEKVRKVILAYGNIDLELGYNQGYNYLIALMLHYIDDEEDVFWMLHRIMFDLNWREFYLDGMSRGLYAIERVTEIFEGFPEICAKLD